MQNKGIYATEIELSASTTLLNFKRSLDQRIHRAINSRKEQQNQHSAQLLRQLTQIREKAENCRTSLQEKEREFKEGVEQTIGKDIRQQRDYQLFFKGHFQHLEQEINRLKSHNKTMKAFIIRKAQTLKEKQGSSQSLQPSTRLRSRIKTLPNQLIRDKSKAKLSPITKGHTLQSSLTSNPRLKTDSSLPLLPRHPKQSRTGSYMEPIGAVRRRESSGLGQLATWLQWYRGQVDPESTWFLKVLFNQRNYKRLQDYISYHSGSRLVTYKP